MPAFIRSLLVTVVAMLGAAMLAVGSTLTGAAAALADPVALIMGNSGRPWPEAPYVANAMRRYIEPNSTCGEVSCQARPVYGPEEFWPVYGGLTALSFNRSTEVGLDYLDAALQQQLHAEPGENVVIFGYSQSGRITNLQLRNLADPAYAEDNDKIVPDADQLEVVLVGNWSRPNGGIGARFNGLTIPFIGITFDGATPTDTGYRMTDISYEYDIISDAPLYPINLLATLNATLGFFYAHLTYADPSAINASFPWGSTSEESFAELLASATVQKYPGKGQDPNGNPEDWDNTYVLIPSKHLPLLQPIRDLAAVTGTSGFIEPVMKLIEPTLKVLIDTGYDRTIPMGQNTPARLIPRINLVTLTADLGKALDRGIRDALGMPSVTPAAPTDTSSGDITATFTTPEKAKMEDEFAESAEDSSDISAVSEDSTDDEKDVSDGSEHAAVDEDITETADTANDPATTPEPTTSESAADSASAAEAGKPAERTDRAPRKPATRKSDDNAAA